MRTQFGYAVVVALASSALAGCEHEYVYRPAVSTTAATVAGRPASYYDIPPETPRGHVRIATIGFAAIQPRGGGGNEELRALHLRMIVADNSDRPWTVDTREQRAALPGAGESRPLYATVDQGTPPIITIAAGDARTIDLFYPLPEHMQEAKEVPSFDVIWRVDTDSRAVVERTPFERIEILPRDTYPDYYAWDTPYWYDPYYLRGSFVGVGVRPVFVERPVMIHGGGGRRR